MRTVVETKSITAVKGGTKKNDFTTRCRSSVTLAAAIVTLVHQSVTVTQRGYYLDDKEGCTISLQRDQIYAPSSLNQSLFYFCAATWRIFHLP